MSRIIWYDQVICVPFPTGQYNRYLRKAQIGDEKLLTDRDRTRIFVTAVADFKQGGLSLDQLSEIAERLLESAHTASKVVDVLETCAEIKYVIRNDTGGPSPFDEYMALIMAYYDQNKTQLHPVK